MKDAEGRYWYNPDCNMHTLCFRFGSDIEITQYGDEVSLRFTLDRAYRDKIPKEFWKQFLDDPRPKLAEEDFFWARIKDTEKWWLRHCLPAKVECVVADNFLFENLGQRLFFFGKSSQKIFAVMEKVTCKADECCNYAREEEKTTSYFTLESYTEWALDTKGLELTKGLTPKDIEMVQNHCRFLRSLPHWGAIKDWTGAEQE